MQFLNNIFINLLLLYVESVSVVQLAKQNPTFQTPFLWIPNLNGSLIQSMQSDFDLVNYMAYLAIPALLVFQYFVNLLLDQRQTEYDPEETFKVTNYQGTNMMMPLLFGAMSFSGPPTLGLNWLADGLIQTCTLLAARERLKKNDDLDVVKIQTCDAKINYMLREKFGEEIAQDTELSYDPLTGQISYQ